MDSSHRSVVCLLALFAVAGCASTQVTRIDAPMQDEEIARPGRIIVHDFAATPDAIPADSSLAGQVAEPAEPMTAEELEAGRELGAVVARELVAAIQNAYLTDVFEPLASQIADGNEGDCPF